MLPIPGDPSSMSVLCENDTLSESAEHGNDGCAIFRRPRSMGRETKERLSKSKRACEVPAHRLTSYKNSVLVTNRLQILTLSLVGVNKVTAYRVND